MTTRFLTSPWAALINESPSLAFATFGPVRGNPRFANRSSNFLSAFNQSDLFREFQAAQGQQIVSGDDPTLTFGSFLQNVPFWRRFLDLDPRERGERPGNFAPRLRFNL